MSMLNTIKNWYHEVKDTGIRFPYAYDAEKKTASSTLFYCYISFYFVLASLVTLHVKPELMNPSLVTIGFFSICMLFYRLRKIDKLKVDLSNKSLEVENNEKEKSE